MPKWARLTRHVESSMIKLTGTRSQGFSTAMPAGGEGGRAPGSWARTDRASSSGKPGCIPSPRARLAPAVCIKLRRPTSAIVFPFGSLAVCPAVQVKPSRPPNFKE